MTSGLGILGAALAAGIGGAGEGAAMAAQNQMKEDATAQQIHEQAQAQLGNAEQLRDYQIQAQRGALMWKQQQIASMVQNAGQTAADNYASPTVSGGLPTNPDGTARTVNGAPAVGIVGNVMDEVTRIQNDPTIAPADKTAAIAQIQGQQQLDTTPQGRQAAGLGAMSSMATLAGAYAAFGDPEGAKNILTGAAALKNADQKVELLKASMDAKLEQLGQVGQDRVMSALVNGMSRNNPTQSGIDELKAQGATPVEVKQFLFRSVLPGRDTSFYPNPIGNGGTIVDKASGAITQFSFDPKTGDPITHTLSVGGAGKTPGPVTGTPSGGVLVWDPKQGKLVAGGQ